LNLRALSRRASQPVPPAINLHGDEDRLQRGAGIELGAPEDEEAERRAYYAGGELP
jgi:hypothetical protein